MALVEAYGLPGAIQVAISGPTIQAVDDPESTFYVLRRPGLPDVHADWPHPLLELEPRAMRIPACSSEGARHGIVVSLTMNDPLWEEREARSAELAFERAERAERVRVAKLDKARERRRRKAQARRLHIAQQRERERLRERAAALRAWRSARPGRWLRTGRKHNKSARLSEADIREIQRRHYTGYESLRSICREMWEERGYKSPDSMLNTICATLDRYGLKKRSPAEMTAQANRLRSMRLPGETKDQFRWRRRRETGEIRGVICAATKTTPGRGGKRRCVRPAMADSEFCRNHDPRFAEERNALLERSRAKARARLVDGTESVRLVQEAYMREGSWQAASRLCGVSGKALKDISRYEPGHLMKPSVVAKITAGLVVRETLPHPIAKVVKDDEPDHRPVVREAA